MFRNFVNLGARSQQLTGWTVGRSASSAVASQIQASLGKHKDLAAFVEEYAELCGPSAIHVCDGSDAEYDSLMALMVEKGVKIPLNPEKRANSYLTRTDPRDVARSEERTFISSVAEEDAGPTNNWRDPKELKEMMHGLYDKCMEGRTMYVVPFSMGPLGGDKSRLGVQLTDSPHVAVSMKIMTRMGQPALDLMEAGHNFVKCVHSVGYPLPEGKDDVVWPCDPDNMHITHFPEENLAASYGSGAGGNALLGKKCFALRLASVMGRDEGWLAEHMLILGLTSPEGEKKYIAAAFPSACGKTNLAMLEPALKGWKAECVGDDIAWMRFGEDGRLYAINPEAGFFGVAPGTSSKTNAHAMNSLDRDCIFTNVGLTPDGDIWWEGMSDEAPEGTINWRNQVHDPSSGEPVAHGNSRFTVPSTNCEVLDPAFDDPNGVPIDAIVFGGRRPTTIPLVHEALDWNHGVYLGASVASQKTAAASGDDIGVVRRDPFAMLPFCGYNMGDYFQHWINMGKKTENAKLPKVFMVNWFRQDPDSGDFLWPGFGDNARVLKWIHERCNNNDSIAKDSPIGIIPADGALDTSNLDIPQDVLNTLLEVDVDAWKAEVDSSAEYLTSTFGSKLPEELLDQIKSIKTRLE